MEIPNIPGVGFCPTDHELLTVYLKQRILDHFQDPNATWSKNGHVIPDVDIYTMHPQQLPRHINSLVNVRSNRREWFFFCFLQEKYRNSNRVERTVLKIGSWKVTSKLKDVRSEVTGKKIGTKNILTFIERSVGRKIKTNWILHEYHLNASTLGYNITNMPLVICRLYDKGGVYDETTCLGDEPTHDVTLATQDVSKDDMWQLPQIERLMDNLPNYNNNNYTDVYTNEASSSWGHIYHGYNASNYPFDF